MSVDPHAPLLERVLVRLTSPPLLTAVAAVLAVGSALIVLQYVLTLDGPIDGTGEIVAGDFAAFYTGARLVWEGGPLYDLGAQEAAQVELLGQSGEWQPYVNPPGLALVLAPVGGLSFVQAYRVFALLTGASLLGALVLLRPAVPELCRRWMGWLTLALVAGTYMPLARTAAGGQNTTLTLLLVTAFFVALRGERPWLAGLLLGLLTYKPQYGTLLVLILLLRREWKPLAGATVVATVHYTAAAVVLGTDWIGQEAAAMRVYQPLEWSANALTHVSLLPALRAPLGTVGAMVAAVAIVAVVAVVARAARGDLRLAFALALVGSMLASPHLQYYDLGVLVLPVVLGLEARTRTGRVATWPLRLGLAVAWLGWPLWSLGPTLGVQPLVLIPIGVFAWLAWEAERLRPQEGGAGTW